MFLMKLFLNQNDQTRKLIYLVKRRKENAKTAEKEGNLHGRRINTIDDLIDFIYSNECSKKKLVFTNKASKNVEIYQKIISEVRKRCEERGEIYAYTLEHRSKFKALVSVCKGTVMLHKTSSGIKNFVE